jgi:DNA repair exonuclease SbcCD nuclease subunit
MKILHTSDWHLGKKLEGRDRLDEQRAVLNEIAEIAESRNIDIVLAAGDIFDNAIPGADAEALFYESLVRISDYGKRKVILIAGNHDDVERVTAAQSLARAYGIYLSSGAQSVTIEAGGETAVFALLSYPTDARMAEFERLCSFGHFSLSEPVTESRSKENSPAKKEKSVGELSSGRSERDKTEIPNAQLKDNAQSSPQCTVHSPQLKDGSIHAKRNGGKKNKSATADCETDKSATVDCGLCAVNCEKSATADCELCAADCEKSATVDCELCAVHCEETFSERVGRWFRPAARDFRPDSINIAVSHLFVQGGTVGGGEREIELGGAKLVDRKFLPDCHYTALGHLHKQQAIDAERHVYYSGSILPCYFDEWPDKCVIEVDCSPGAGVRSVEMIPLKSGRRLTTLTADSFTDALDKLTARADDYVSLELTLPAPLSDSENKLLKTTFPNLLKISLKLPEQEKRRAVNVRVLPKAELFRGFYLRRTGTEPTEEMTKLFLELMESE